MNKKLGRLLRPSRAIYFTLMGLFCAATVAAEQYWLAAAEAAVTLAAFALYMVNRKRRDRQILQYIQSASNTLEAMGQGESPFPTTLVRLGDGAIVWSNHRFSDITGIGDSMLEQRLQEVLPGFSTDWLAERKTEPWRSRYHRRCRPQPPA